MLWQKAKSTAPFDSDTESFYLLILEDISAIRKAKNTSAVPDHLLKTLLRLQLIHDSHYYFSAFIFNYHEQGISIEIPRSTNA